MPVLHRARQLAGIGVFWIFLGWVGCTAPADVQLPQATAVPGPQAVAADPTSFPTYPLPDGDPPPLGPAVFRSGFSDALPPSPVWNPPGQKRVGIQVGHWQLDDLPNELRNLSAGSSAAGWDEWEVNLLVAQQAQNALEAAGVQVDLLPAVIPIRYRAHAFVAIHADGDVDSSSHGYKVARSVMSSIPGTDDLFVRMLEQEYGAVTELSEDATTRVSRRMTDYYAFNTRRYQHAIDLGTPAAIIEAGYLTNPGDRAFLTGHADLAGQGIADGILRFLEAEDDGQPDG